MTGFRRRVFALSLSEEHEKQHDYEDQGEERRRRIAPAGAVWVQGKNAEKQQPDRDQQQDFHVHNSTTPAVRGRRRPNLRPDDF